MIFDTLDRASQYAGLGEHMDTAFEYLRTADLDALQTGRVDLNNDLYVMVQRFTTRLPETGVWETHRKYIDIHYIVSGQERIGFANLTETQPFAVEVRRSLERAVQEAGNVDLVLADNQLDPAVALQVGERFLQQGLDLVIEFQIDEQTGNRLMSRFQEAGLPVIAVDIPMVGATYFGVDNYKAGYLAGSAMGDWVCTHWSGQWDQVLVLEEPRAGALPASRIAGQLDGLKARLGEIPPEKQVRLNCANTAEKSAAELEAIVDALRILEPETAGLDGLLEAFATMIDRQAAYLPA